MLDQLTETPQEPTIEVLAKESQGLTMDAYKTTLAMLKKRREELRTELSGVEQAIAGLMHATGDKRGGSAPRLGIADTILAKLKEINRAVSPSDLAKLISQDKYNWPPRKSPGDLVGTELARMHKGPRIPVSRVGPALYTYDAMKIAGEGG